MKNQQYQYLCLVEELRKRLQDGELQSGSAIPSEAELAKALSLSKREVRPLLKNLEIAGILSGSRDGTYTLAKEMWDSMRELVQNISPFEVCQMRRSMELSAFPMAYARRDHLDLDELKNLLDEFRYGNGLDSIRADEEMHRWLIRASGNRLMECVTQGIWGICSAQINLILSDGRNCERCRRASMSGSIRAFSSVI